MRPLGRLDSESSRSAAGRPWLTSILIGGAVIVAIDLVFWLALPIWRITLHSPTYADLYQLTKSGRLIWEGRWTNVYGAVPEFLALPLSLGLMAPLTPLLSHLDGNQLRSVSNLVAGTYVLSFGILLLYAVRMLLWEVGARSQIWVVQLVTAVMTLVPTFEFGHGEDVLALTLVVHSIRRTIKGQSLASALFLSAAISCKQWALMIVPLIAFSAARRARLRTLVVSLILPLVLTIGCLAADGSAAARAFFTPGSSNPTIGHEGLSAQWFGPYSSITSRVVALVFAISLGLLLRKNASPVGLLGPCAAVLAIRPLMETVNYSYYWSPALVLAVIATASTGRRPSIGMVVWPLAAVAWAIPPAAGSSGSGWWSCELILLGAVVITAARQLGVGARLRSFTAAF